MLDSVGLLVACSWFAGGFVSGVTGIGGAMVAFPIAATVIPITELIPLSCILNVIMDGCIACMHFRHCRVKALWPMFIGSIPGAIIGLYILKFVPSSVLEGAIGAFLLYYVYWQHTYKPTGKRRESLGRGGSAGFAAGLLGTSISFDGPPIAAYGLFAGWGPRVFLGTLGVFFVIRGSMTCGLHAFSGLYTENVIHYAMYGIPAALVGTLCSFPVVRRFNVETFRKLLMYVIVAAGFICLGRAIL